MTNTTNIQMITLTKDAAGSYTFNNGTIRAKMDKMDDRKSFSIDIWNSDDKIVSDGWYGLTLKGCREWIAKEIKIVAQ